MRKPLHLTLGTALFFLLFNSCNENTNSKAKVALGMVIQDRKQLVNIPFADVPFGGTELPESVDWSSKMPEVGNQGAQQSCVAWSVAYALKSYQENVQLGEKMLFSPSFIYNQINNGENVPTAVPDALRVLSEQGVCLLDEMPYDEKDWKSKPTGTLRESAKRFRIANWRQINTADIKEVKTFLAGGLPVIVGAQVSEEFIQDGFRKGADYEWKEKGKPSGGHAMLVVGYDNTKEAFRVINSWGKNWGDGGYVWVDYKLFQDPDAVMYGFVTKDDFTDPEAIQKQSNEEKPIEDQPNNPINENPDDKVVKDEPNDNPLEYDQIDFHQKNVIYDVKNPDPKNNTAAMKIEGTINIPPRYGQNFQIVVHIYNTETNEQVKTLIYPEYSDINRFVAGYTQPIPLDEERWKGKWWVHIPYNAMDLPGGTKTYLYGIPTLFVDNYAVAKGEKIEFWVQ